MVALLIVSPAYAAYSLAARAVGPTAAFPGWSQAFSLLPGLFGIYLRRAFYRLTLDHCADDVTIGFGTIFSDPGARLGRAANVGVFCTIGRITLGDDVLLASHVSIINGGRQHEISRLDVPIRLQSGVFSPISIGGDCWIGERAVVMADVGRHCVIGAGSVVTKPLNDYAIAVGVPARVIGSRNDSRELDGGPK